MRGGVREGAGRKPVTEKEKRVQMVITIAPETKERLKTLSKEKGVPIGRIIDTFVK